MPRLARAAVMASLLVASGCAVELPSGPEALVLPGKGKSLATFEADDVACRRFAANAIPSGAKAAQLTSGLLQRRYDVAYVQCMAANGEEVPKILPPAAQPGYPYAWWAYAWPYYPAYFGPPLFGFGPGFVFFHGHGFRHHRRFVGRHRLRHSRRD